MSLELVEALKQLETEKNLEPGDVIDALEQALVSAFRKNYRIEDEEVEIRVNVSHDTGDIRVFKKEPGEDEEKDVTPDNFGRIAAQTAKQVILQRIREAERGQMFEEYRGREGDIVTGIVQQSDARYTLISLGKVEALLPPNEQVPTERYRHGTRLKAYITEVRKTTKDPQIVVSRSHPGLLRKLFELEVPEIVEGFCEIKAVAREPGSRSKIAVHSSDSNVDPVGSCVGPRGSRVRMVVGELWGEKIDVVHYDDEISVFVANALSPAKVTGVNIKDEELSAEVIVPDDQLSLAIGKEGQNARLAAKLTGWRIDIKSETQAKKEELGEGLDQAEEELAVEEDKAEAVEGEEKEQAKDEKEESAEVAPEPEEPAEEKEPDADEESSEKKAEEVKEPEEQAEKTDEAEKPEAEADEPKKAEEQSVEKEEDDDKQKADKSEVAKKESTPNKDSEEKEDKPEEEKK
ncbi:hypothetical protein LCGC14_0649090 [marine sediment metagenome]|uniref:S1 motif domain-containing protein n=1 Tax=marine sediment metagenome TaxID=412755 RepID=A0A0F9RGM1_9ZZZZ|nr:transcription termination/antitermination protein NusA [Actinomycetota bacterium]